MQLYPNFELQNSSTSSSELQEKIQTATHLHLCLMDESRRELSKVSIASDYISGVAEDGLGLAFFRRSFIKLVSLEVRQENTSSIAKFTREPLGSAISKLAFPATAIIQLRDDKASRQKLHLIGAARGFLFVGATTQYAIPVAAIETIDLSWG